MPSKTAYNIKNLGQQKKKTFWINNFECQEVSSVLLSTFSYHTKKAGEKNLDWTFFRKKKFSKIKQ